VAPSWIALVLVLWLAVIVETVLILGLSRRITALESANRSAVAPMAALPIGSPIPRPAWERLSTRSTDTPINRSVILFLSSSCGPCRNLADALQGHRLGRGPGDEFEIIVVSSDPAHDGFSHIGRIVADPGGTVAKSLMVPGTPFGVAADSDGIVRALAIPNSLADVARLADAREPADPGQMAGVV
jgi:hypothetical protein